VTGHRLREAKSPDGRVWKIESHRRLSFGKITAVDLASLVVTAIMIVVLVFFAIVFPSPGAAYIRFGAAMLFLIWLLERGTIHLRPMIEATTDGPPREHVGWVATSRFGHRRLERRAVEAIERGDPASEPRGLRLVEL